MDTSQVFDRLQKVFHDVFDDDEIVVTAQTTAKDIDGWDSLKQVRLLLSVERTFGVKFSASEAGRLDNVGDLAALVLSKV